MNGTVISLSLYVTLDCKEVPIFTVLTFPSDLSLSYFPILITQNLFSCKEIFLEDPEASDNSDDKDTFNIPTQRKKSKPEKIQLEISSNFTDDPDLTAEADRRKISNQAYFSITAAILKKAGVEENMVSLSKETIRRNRNKNREELAEKIRRDFAESTKEDILSLHWDEKIMEDIDHTHSEKPVILGKIEQYIECFKSTIAGTGLFGWIWIG